MCRKRQTCSELGSDSTLWSKICPLPLPEYFEKAVDSFTDSIECLLQGDLTASLENLKKCNSELIGQYFIEHGQQSAYFRVSNRDEIDKSNRENKSLNESPRLKSSIEKKVFLRDSYRCRYCGQRIISKEVFKEFSRLVGPEMFSVARKNSLRNGLTLGLRGVGDHVDPYSLGGQTDTENLVTSCYSCNFGKAGYTLDQLGIEDPRLREPIADGWLGLTEHMPALKKLTLSDKAIF
jgi:5-methylcytosine-specific restriction endonuclease McrA